MSHNPRALERRRRRERQHRKEHRCGQGGYGRRPDQLFIKGEIVKQKNPILGDRPVQTYIPVTRKGVHLLRLYTFHAEFFTHKPEPPLTETQRIKRSAITQQPAELDGRRPPTKEDIEKINEVWKGRRPISEEDR